jgi:hypothetical protein
VAPVVWGGQSHPMAKQWPLGVAGHPQGPYNKQNKNFTIILFLLLFILKIVNNNLLLFF